MDSMALDNCLAWLSYRNAILANKHEDKLKAALPNAATLGEHSPASVQNANTKGDNSPVLQNSPGSTISYGLSDASVELIRKGMEEEQRELDSQLSSIFSVGYFLFTVSKRGEFVPYDVPKFSFTVDWKSAGIKKITPDYITLVTPTIKFPEAGNRVKNLTIANETIGFPTTTPIGQVRVVDRYIDLIVAMAILKRDQNGVMLVYGFSTNEAILAPWQRH